MALKSSADISKLQGETQDIFHFILFYSQNLRKLCSFFEIYSRQNHMSIANQSIFRASREVIFKIGSNNDKPKRMLFGK